MTQHLEAMEAVAELGRVNLAETDFAQLLTRVSELAKQTIPGAAEVSVTIIRDGSAVTAAFSGDLALHLDEKQYDAGHGPCLDAAQGGTAVVIDDMRTEDRWPGYTFRALQRGALSSVSVALPLQQATTGALNIYGNQAHAFDAEAADLAETFAAYAAVALANAQVYESAAALATQMQEAMASRAVIEQAKGVLVSQLGCTPERAFDLLSKASQNGNRKLHGVAKSIVAAAADGRTHLTPAAENDSGGG